MNVFQIICKNKYIIRAPDGDTQAVGGQDFPVQGAGGGADLPCVGGGTE